MYVTDVIYKKQHESNKIPKHAVWRKFKKKKYAHKSKKFYSAFLLMWKILLLFIFFMTLNYHLISMMQENFDSTLKGCCLSMHWKFISTLVKNKLLCQFLSKQIIERIIFNMFCVNYFSLRTKVKITTETTTT